MKENQVEHIANDSYRKKYQVGESQCEIEIEDALYGDYQGKRILLDEDVIGQMCHDIVKQVVRHKTKYNPLPCKIKISHTMDVNDVEVTKQTKNPLFHSEESRFDLVDVALPQETREQIVMTLSAIKNKDKLDYEWGLSHSSASHRSIVLNFYGAPGTGKSMTAKAIAKYLKKECICINYSELESKYVGETPKNIKRAFQEANERDAVLIFDEADSFLGKRLTNMTQSADYGVNITRSVMLMELENYQGIVVFTTNLLANYDEAFKRRIFASVEFMLPDLEARCSIFKLHMGDKLPLGEGVSAEVLAQKYEEISGADIKDIVYYAAISALNRERDEVSLEDFEQAYQYIKKRYA